MFPASPSPSCRVSSVILLAMIAAHAAAADFPPPDQLPGNPSLPDPLVMMDGTPVTTKEQWEAKRKPELKALFQHYMYGKLPPTPKKQTYKVLFNDDKALGGKAKLSEVQITFDEPKLDHAIHVLLVIIVVILGSPYPERAKRQNEADFFAICFATAAAIAIIEAVRRSA